MIEFEEPSEEEEEEMPSYEELQKEYEDSKGEGDSTPVAA